MRFLTDGQASPTGTHGAPTQLAVTTCTPVGIEEQQAAEAEGGGQKADEGTGRALAMRCPPVGPALPARSTVPPLPTLQKLGRNSLLATSAHGSAPCLPAAPRRALGVGGSYRCGVNSRTGLLRLSHPKTVKMRKPSVLAARTLDFLIEGSVISP